MIQGKLINELKKYYKKHTLTLANWPSIIVTALQELDILLEDGKHKRCSLSFPVGLEQKREGSIFAGTLRRLSHNEENIELILGAIQGFIGDPELIKDDKPFYDFLANVFKWSGRALIEIIGEVHYQKIKCSSARRNSIRVFKQMEAERLYTYLLADIQHTCVTMGTWPLLVAAAKHYADTHYGMLEMNSRKQIIVEALANLIDHLSKLDKTIRDNTSFILETMSPILDLLMGEEEEGRSTCPCPCWPF